MREFIVFLTAVVILAIAQTVASAPGVLLLILATLGAFAFPRAACQLIASLGLLALALKEPAYCIAALGTVGVTAVASAKLRKRSVDSVPPMLRLTDSRAG